MIRRCVPDDFERMLAIINEAALAYRGVIPDDRWKDPYMPAEELAAEIAAGIVFDGYEIDSIGLVGVMGVQAVKDVTLIRHAYVAPGQQRSGIGSALLTGAVPTSRPADPDRYMGRRRLGDCFLFAAWLRGSPGAGEVETASPLLDRSRAPDRDLGGACRSPVARSHDGRAHSGVSRCASARDRGHHDRGI